MSEVVVFTARFDLASVSPAGRQLRKISEKHACNLRLWNVGDAFVRSPFVNHTQCAFRFTHQSSEERFKFHINGAKEIISIAMRNVVVGQCYFECFHAAEERGCILSAYSDIADHTIVRS